MRVTLIHNPGAGEGEHAGEALRSVVAGRSEARGIYRNHRPDAVVGFGGGNGRSNGFFIDGLENINNSGGVRDSVSQEAVQEFQINRNSFSAEYGWTSGGTVNILTRSGTNEFEAGFARHIGVGRDEGWWNGPLAGAREGRRWPFPVLS